MDRPAFACPGQGVVRKVHSRWEIGRSSACDDVFSSSARAVRAVRPSSGAFAQKKKVCLTQRMDGNEDVAMQPSIAGRLGTGLATAAVAKLQKRRSRNLHPDHDEVTFRQGLYIPQPLRYTTRDWILNLRTWPTSPLWMRIRAPVMTFTLWSVFLMLVHKHLEMLPALTLSAHSLVGTALGLLLVFRTNSAYGRFWEGRRMWETVVSTSRDIVVYTCALERQMRTARLLRICRLVRAFPVCLAQYVTGNPVPKPPPLRQLLPRDAHHIQAAHSPPCRVIQLMWSEITRLPDSVDGLLTSRERNELARLAGKLLAAVATCERLVQTPIPQSYVRHTSRFLSLWLLTLPLGLCHLIGWWTPWVIMAASWALCGIQELGQVIEHPFEGPQSLRLGVMCNSVHASISDSLHYVATLRSTGFIRRVVMKLEPFAFVNSQLSAAPTASKAELDLVDSVLGRTPLHHAAFLGDAEVVQYLVEARADLHATDTWDGSTPLDVALARNNVAAADALIQAGGSSNIFSSPLSEVISP
mmetsp:Transcript_31605/g.69795  ORF Transcript_31605/g.69795 Transcript_31605/m.69795 type:complete len:527 (-) Transcript_31605:87-1667(-)